MVRAIARLAVIQAAQSGRYHACFRGFDVYAVRNAVASHCAGNAVSFVISHCAKPIEQGVLVMLPLQP
jgi:hypothetical protein